MSSTHVIVMSILLSAAAVLVANLLTELILNNRFSQRILKKLAIWLGHEVTASYTGTKTGPGGKHSLNAYGLDRRIFVYTYKGRRYRYTTWETDQTFNYHIKLYFLILPWAAKRQGRIGIGKVGWALVWAMTAAAAYYTNIVERMF